MAAAISDALTCPVCYDYLDDPKILTCGHTFCKKCLDDMYRTDSLNHLTCPMCRKVTQIPKGDVSKLLSNIAVKSITDDLKFASRGDLQRQAEIKIGLLIEHAEFVGQQKEKVKEAMSVCRTEVGKAYNEAIAKLSKRKDVLLQSCDSHESELLGRLDELAERDIELVTNISNASEPGGKGTSSDRLKDLLRTAHADLSEATEITRRAEMLHLKKKQVNLDLGTVQEVLIKSDDEDQKQDQWKPKVVVMLTKTGNSAMAPTPDGRMAVGYAAGGISMFSADGHWQQTVLKDVKIQEVGFLSDGRCVVRDSGNKLSLYTRDWRKLDVVFTTKIRRDSGGLAVDSDDHIYVGCRDSKKIYVFKSKGGRAIKEISCEGHMPWQIYVTEPSKTVVVVTDAYNVRVFNHQGRETHKVNKDNCHVVRPTASKNGNILIAVISKERDRVSIEQYTSELKYVQTLVVDHVIQKTERVWSCLQQFSCGEIAFCTADKLHIFNKIVSTPDG